MNKAGTHRNDSPIILESIDKDFRKYMLKVYNYMVGGLGVTAFIMYAALNIPEFSNLLFDRNELGQVMPSSLSWLLFIIELGLLFFLSFRIHHMGVITAQLSFWTYVSLMGLTLAPVLYAFTGTNIGRVFLIASMLFGSMSLYGYTTKQDLTSLGFFMLMGLVGILLTSIINLYFKSTMTEFVISILGIFIFMGITAYDTQKIKQLYLEEQSSARRIKRAIIGALALYLDFFNLFLFLLRLSGKNNNR